MTRHRLGSIVSLASVTVGVAVLTGCSSDEVFGEGFVLVGIETISLCEEIDATSVACVGTLHEVQRFSVLDSSKVTLVGGPPISYSTERVRLVRTDSDPLVYELQPVNG